jgi:Putative beta-barrel porin 2
MTAMKDRNNPSLQARFALRRDIGRHLVQRALPGFCLTSALLACVPCADAAPDAADPFDFFVSDRYLYDDNLFRVHEGSLPADPALAKSRDDSINRLSAGIAARLDASRQVFALNLRADDVRYQNNDDLDYTGGSGTLLWDWKLGHGWSGRVQGSYDRALASFNNYTLFVRDVVDVASYGAQLHYDIGSRFGVYVGGNIATAEHSAEIRKVNEFRGETGRAGLEYKTPSGNVFALGYDFTDATFPTARRTVGTVAPDYEDTTPSLSVAYAFTVKTSLYARLGYLSRDYDDPILGDFSGDVWNVNLHWEPRAKLYFDVKAWRQLKAYSDAETDYFVATGGSITPTWEPTETIKIAAILSSEKQHYTGTELLLPQDTARRKDDVNSANVSIEYTPRNFVSVELGYNWVNRDSNRELRAYDDNVAYAQLKFTL